VGCSYYAAGGHVCKNAIVVQCPVCAKEGFPGLFHALHGPRSHRGNVAKYKTCAEYRAMDKRAANLISATV
jgi:hypothetical protein